MNQEINDYNNSQFPNNVIRETRYKINKRVIDHIKHKMTNKENHSKTITKENKK